MNNIAFNLPGNNQCILTIKTRKLVMKKSLLFFVVLQILLVTGYAQTRVDSLLTENRKNPIGIDAAMPRFSWQLINNGRDIKQTAYEINITKGKDKVWQSGKVMSDSSVHVAYKGNALQSGTKYTWQVRVWDNSGKPQPGVLLLFFKQLYLIYPTGKQNG